jgi:hypothetical protein
LVMGARPTAACGGLFCQNDPVDQAAERIIFAKNDDGTITTIVQIDYTGSAPDFSWILPLPSPITAEDIAVPEDADEAFTELHDLTDVRIIPPPAPDCVMDMRDMVFSASAEMASEVIIFASGEVGPYGFDVIGSEDPNALIDWLRQNNYRVEPPMEPIINAYVEEEHVFLAMRLLPEETADSIAPIQITYAAEKPMIPIRLTAVAANPNMGIYVWIYGQEQAIPENYAHMEIDNREITVFDFGGNNYQQLVNQRADANNGQAFITEFAGATSTLRPQNPLLQQLGQNYAYVTRLYTTMSAEEMTLDPVFGFDGTRPAVSNVRDLTQYQGLYSCERDERVSVSFAASDALEPFTESGQARPAPDTSTAAGGGISLGWIIGIAAVGLLIVGLVLRVFTRE